MNDREKYYASAMHKSEADLLRLHTAWDALCLADEICVADLERAAQRGSTIYHALTDLEGAERAMLYSVDVVASPDEIIVIFAVWHDDTCFTLTLESAREMRTPAIILTFIDHAVRDGKAWSMTNTMEMGFGDATVSIRLGGEHVPV